MEYLLLLVSVLTIFASVKYVYKLQLFKSKKQTALTFFSLFLVGSALDSFALLRGYWSYNEEFFVGVTVGVMPLEEYLFMIVIPYLTLVVYRLVRTKSDAIQHVC